MKLSRIILAISFLLPALALAVSIQGTLPTTLANGGAFAPQVGDTVNVSKNGGAAVLYTVTASQVGSGAFSFTDASASACTRDAWTATYTSIASGLTSPPTAGVATQIDGVGCAVKFQAGLIVK